MRHHGSCQTMFLRSAPASTFGTGEDDTFQETLKNMESATFAVQKS